MQYHGTAVIQLGGLQRLQKLIDSFIAFVCWYTTIASNIINHQHYSSAAADEARAPAAAAALEICQAGLTTVTIARKRTDAVLVRLVQRYFLLRYRTSYAHCPQAKNARPARYSAT